MMCCCILLMSGEQLFASLCPVYKISAKTRNDLHLVPFLGNTIVALWFNNSDIGTVLLMLIVCNSGVLWGRGTVLWHLCSV